MHELCILCPSRQQREAAVRAVSLTNVNLVELSLQVSSPLNVFYILRFSKQVQKWRSAGGTNGICQKASECLHAVSEGEERAVACRNAPEWELGCEHASGKGGKSFLSLG